MKGFKSLLLGSAAAVVAVAGASAADLGVKKPTPVEYVKVCSVVPGQTGFVLPGSDICLTISGRVRAEVRYTEPFDRGAGGSGNVTELFTRAQVGFLAASQTEYGPLQTFIRYQLNVGRSQQIAGGDAQARIDAGFINWAGFTIGRAPSFYDFVGGQPFGTSFFNDVNPVNLVAYTANFGGGFTASIALEDALQTRTGASSTAAQTFFVGNAAGTNTAAYTYGAQRMPDVVANIRVDQAWGSAMLSGAVHQLFSNTLVTRTGTTVATTVDTEYGFGINAGVKINLPMLAAGDYLILAANYSQGALRFGGNNTGTGSVPAFLGGGVPDAFIDAFGRVHKTDAFSAEVALRHNWTPTLRSDFQFSYAQVDFDAIGTTRTAAGVNSGFVDTKFWQVGANLQWLPVKGLLIGGEVNYLRIDPRGRVAAEATRGGTIGDADRIEARIRVQRDF